MRTLLKMAPALALAVILGMPNAMASPTPVLTSPVSSHYELVKARKSRLQKRTSTKGWLKQKTNQSSAWVKRQTRKVKSAFK